MGICGYLWVYVGICGYMWVSVGICGYMWVSVGICGYLWVSVGICGYLWVSVGICYVEGGFGCANVYFVSLNSIHKCANVTTCFWNPYSA